MWQPNSRFSRRRRQPAEKEPAQERSGFDVMNQLLAI
jgi:hypothetical protein